MDSERQQRFVERLSQLDRPELMAVLRSMQCEFPIDFTDECLASMSVERLRHVAAAACLHARNLDSFVA